VRPYFKKQNFRSICVLTLDCGQTPTAIIRYFMYLPLNFIPVVGTVAFVALQGRSRGPTAHARYFQLKGMNKTQQEQFVEERKGAYTRYVMEASYRSV